MHFWLMRSIPCVICSMILIFQQSVALNVPSYQNRSNLKSYVANRRSTLPRYHTLRYFESSRSSFLGLDRMKYRCKYDRHMKQVTMMSGLENFALQASSLLVLTMVVAIHEAGHFIAARAQGIRVKNFSIGFGPKLLSYRKSRGLEIGGKEEENDSGVKNAFVEYSLRLVPIGGFVSFPVNLEEDENGEIIEDNDPNLLQNRPIMQRVLVISAGVLANLVLTWVCIFSVVSTQGITQASYEPGVMLSSITDSTGPAAISGLQPKDRLLSINGVNLEAGEASLSNAVTMIRSSGGNSIEVELQRNGQNLKKIISPYKKQGGSYSIGVRLSPNVARSTRIQATNPFEAGKLAWQESGHLIQLTLNALRKSVTTGDLENISGPIGVVQQGAELAKDDGAMALLQFAAIISVNLAVINSLPIPGLDGGQMAFLAVEAIEGKKMKRGVSEAINGTAIFLLLLLSASTILGDLVPIVTVLVKQANGALSRSH